jgi:azurin
MTFRRNLGLASFVAAFIALVVGGATAASAAPRVIQIVGTEDMKYSVTKIDAKPGEELKIVLTGKGSMPKDQMAHNFLLLAAGTNTDDISMKAVMARGNNYIPKNVPAGTILASTGLAGGGETVEVTFKAPTKPGAYPYMCTFPAHYAGGMKGVLTVK